MGAALPLVIVFSACLIVRAVVKRAPLTIYVLHGDGEFAHLPDFLERVRGRCTRNEQPLVLILDFQHEGLKELYESQLKWRIMWPSGFERIISQALLLQSSALVSYEYLITARFDSARASQMPLATESLTPGPRIVSVRASTMRRIGLENQRYVALAVNTSRYELLNNPRYAQKSQYKETIGESLSDALDALSHRGVKAVLLGSQDTDVSRIPRELPRLSDFGKLGGIEEVALASGCEYFWNDWVGCWWLGIPFGKPVLCTNQGHLDVPTQYMPPVFWLSLPLRLKSESGREFTLREMLHNLGLRRSATRQGDVKVIRNSADEITAANLEMISRLEGTWQEDSLMEKNSRRVKEIFAEVPDCHAFTISSHFLLRHPYFLD